MGWLIALAAVVLLSLLPLGVCAAYDVSGLLLELLIGPVRVTIYPTKTKKKKVAPKKDAANKKDTPKNANTAGIGGSLTDFMPLLQYFVDFLGDFRRKLRVRRLELRLVMAGDDPCDLAVNYGKAWAAVGNLMPQLERIFTIKKRDVQVACDFTENQIKLYAKVDITITLGRLISLLGVHGFKVIREYFKICNLRKGGVTK